VELYVFVFGWSVKAQEQLYLTFAFLLDEQCKSQAYAVFLRGVKGDYDCLKYFEQKLPNYRVFR
jgi:hypothetical protein